MKRQVLTLVVCLVAIAAIGISRGNANETKNVTAAPTFTKDIEPIFFKNFAE